MESIAAHAGMGPPQERGDGLKSDGVKPACTGRGVDAPWGSRLQWG